MTKILAVSQEIQFLKRDGSQKPEGSGAPPYYGGSHKKVDSFSPSEQAAAESYLRKLGGSENGSVNLLTLKKRLSDDIKKSIKVAKQEGDFTKAKALARIAADLEAQKGPVDMKTFANRYMKALGRKEKKEVVNTPAFPEPSKKEVIDTPAFPEQLEFIDTPVLSEQQSDNPVELGLPELGEEGQIPEMPKSKEIDLDESFKPIEKDLKLREQRKSNTILIDPKNPGRAILPNPNATMPKMDFYEDRHSDPPEV